MVYRQSTQTWVNSVTLYAINALDLQLYDIAVDYIKLLSWYKRTYNLMPHNQLVKSLFDCMADHKDELTKINKQKGKLWQT